MASRAFGVPTDEADAGLRRRVKAMSYGLAYGLSAYGLSQQLKISTEEAGEQMDQYFARFGGVRITCRPWSTGPQGRLHRNHGARPPAVSARTDSSRTVSCARPPNGRPQRPDPGSAADIIKVAMIAWTPELREAGSHPDMLLQVHDELLLEIAPGGADAVETLVRERMGGAHPLDVPLRCRWATGPPGTLRRTSLPCEGSQSSLFSVSGALPIAPASRSTRCRRFRR